MVNGRSEVFGASSLALSQTVGFWFTLNPSFMEVRDTTPGNDPHFASVMRDSELVTAVVSIGVAIGASVYADSVMPLLISTATLAILWFVYEREFLMRSPTKEN